MTEYFQEFKVKVVPNCLSNDYTDGMTRYLLNIIDFLR